MHPCAEPHKKHPGKTRGVKYLFSQGSEFLREFQSAVCVEAAADFDELIERYALLLLVGASEVNGDCVLGSFLVAYDEDVRIPVLLQPDKG